MNNKAAYLLSFFAAVFILSAAATPVQAFTFKNGDNILIDEAAPIEGSVFVSGQTIKIKSQINGDVYCAGQQVEISGTINGDVLCAGQQIKISGNVGGNIRAAGQNVDISGKVAKNVTVFGQTVSNSSTIGGEMIAGAQQASIGGQIDSSLISLANNVAIEGRINKDAVIYADQSSLAKNSFVGGSLSYYSKNQLQQENGSLVNGQIIKNDPVSWGQKPKSSPSQILSALVGGTVVWIIMNLVIALLLVLIFPGPVAKTTELMLEKPLPRIGAGLIVLIVTPVISFMIFTTMIGIPLSAIVFALYIVALMLAPVLSGIAIGKMIMKPAPDAKKSKYILATFLGIALSFSLFAIPAIGGFLSLLALAWGLGGIWKFCVLLRENKKPVISGV